MVKLKVIEGGVKHPEACEREFLSAFVSDTRLMGVVGLYIHWAVKQCEETEDLHQFFYLDHEEYGLESYVSIWKDDPEAVADAYQSMIGCLGGESVPLTLEEACAILCEYVSISKAHGYALPAKTSEYLMLISEAPALSESARKELLRRQCTPIHSDYQLVNYFLMRCLGKDYEAAEILTDGHVDTHVFQNTDVSALCRNEIEGSDGHYICQSLVEEAHQYHIFVSEIRVKARCVTSLSLSSGFAVTPQEAAMQLARPEFVTVYDLAEGIGERLDIREDVEYSTIVSSYENGRLFMIFNDTNNHVDRRIFLLNGDVFGICFISLGGQLIAAAYSQNNIQRLERMLARGHSRLYMQVAAKYEFKEPILYDFIQSDYEDFEDFLDDFRQE